MYQHPVFIRRVGKGKEGKVIVCTILNADAFNLDDNESDVFFIASTESNLYTGNKPTITIEPRSKLQSEEYTKAGNCESTIGNGISGILTSPLWFIKKTKSVLELMGM